MKKEFLIIGLTGPLGSGCTTVSKFLANNLKEYTLQCEESLGKIETLIGGYYEYLKNMQDNYNENEKEMIKQKNELFIKPEQLLNQLRSYNSNIYMDEKNKKEVNRKLRELLHTRDILNIYVRAKDWPNFNIVSMSTMIVKLLVENTIDNQLKPTNEFNDFCIKNNISSTLRSDIIESSNKNKRLLERYNEIKEIREPNKIDRLEYNDIDSMFVEIEKLKNKINTEDKNGNLLQDIGDNLRKNGNPFNEKNVDKYRYLSILASEAKGYMKYIKNKNGNSNNYFVIDSFRNPMEINYFRERYASFYLCSVYANKFLRKKRINAKNSKVLTDEIDSRDCGEENSVKDVYKQNVSGCALLADYSINNDNIQDENYDSLKLKIIRLLCLIENPGCTQPTADETFMNIAYTLSVRSTCISRHVGAVITNTEGFVIGAGWNDVGTGQLGCSTRCIKDLSRFSGNQSILSVWREQYEKFRKYNLINDNNSNHYFCFKDLESELKIYEKIDKLVENFGLNEKIKNILPQKDINGNKVVDTFIINQIVDLNSELKKHIKENLKIKRLEYARALHAEENAILQVATNGGIGIKGGTIYTTTFPCELCAKKIYQSGIKRIVYTEPYPNSISENIFLKDGIRNIRVEQFEGVKSSSYYRLFKSPMDKKEMQFLEDLI